MEIFFYGIAMLKRVGVHVMQLTKVNVGASEMLEMIKDLKLFAFDLFLSKKKQMIIFRYCDQRAKRKQQCHPASMRHWTLAIFYIKLFFDFRKDSSYSIKLQKKLEAQD